jgi:hypothetical protein
MLSKSHAKTPVSMCRCSPGFRLFLVPPLLLIVWASWPSPPPADILRNANDPIVSSCPLSFERQRAVSCVRSVEFSWQCMIRSDLELSRSIRRRRHRHRRGLFLHRPSPSLGSVPLREFEIVRSQRQARGNRKDGVPEPGWR